MAERINDLKKRKDLVDKYVEGKGSLNVMHGLTKKLTRTTQQIKLATGMVDEASYDESYERVFAAFEAQYKGIQVLDRQLIAWVRSVKDYLESQEAFASSLEEVYHVGLDDPSRVRPVAPLETVRKYRQLCYQLAGGAWKDAELEIKSAIRPTLVHLLARYKDPLIIIKKRDAKMLDFERANGLKAKGDPVCFIIILKL